MFLGAGGAPFLFCGDEGPCTHYAGAPREHGLAMLGAPGDFLPDEKVTKESPRGDTPLGTPLGGRFAPPAVPATPSIGFHPLTQTDLPL